MCRASSVMCSHVLLEQNACVWGRVGRKTWARLSPRRGITQGSRGQLLTSLVTPDGQGESWLPWKNFGCRKRSSQTST